VAKEFVHGLDLKPGIFYHQEFGAGIRPYTVYGSNGEVPVTKINLTEVSSYANMSKDSTELALHRIIKHLSEKTHMVNCLVISDWQLQHRHPIDWHVIRKEQSRSCQVQRIHHTRYSQRVVPES
jgi:hypothetical protein